MNRGQLVPGRHDRRRVPRPARPARRPRRRDPRRLPPDARPGRGPRRGARRAPAAGSTGRSTSSCRPRTSSPGWPIAGSAPRTATSTTSSRTRRRSRVVCDLDGSELVQRADDREDTVRARIAAADAAARRGRRPLPPRRASWRTSTGAQPIDGVTRDVIRAADGSPERSLTWSPASRAARSTRCARPAASWPRSSPSSRPS